jgi:hypothetical protein
MKSNPTFLFVAAFAALASPLVSYSADWTHIMGPNNNRKVSEAVPDTFALLSIAVWGTKAANQRRFKKHQH